VQWLSTSHNPSPPSHYTARLYCHHGRLSHRPTTPQSRFSQPHHHETFQTTPHPAHCHERKFSPGMSPQLSTSSRPTRWFPCQTWPYLPSCFLPSNTGLVLLSRTCCRFSRSLPIPPPCCPYLPCRFSCRLQRCLSYCLQGFRWHSSCHYRSFGQKRRHSPSCCL
jgi:hypothetical protein